MRWHLFSIGKQKRDHMEIAGEDYFKRIKSKISFDMQIFSKESALLKSIHSSWEVILLDAGGKIFTSSVDLSNFLENKISHSGSDIAFVIGGAYGFGPELLKRSNSKISLSPLTLPHKLAKLVLLEQLYRALSIMHNEPYNH